MAASTWSLLGLASHSLCSIPIFSSSASTFWTRTRPHTCVIKAAQTQGQNPRRRRPQNVEGDLFVDNTCIDCDTCRWMAPDVFTRVDGMSAVIKQPNCEEGRLHALQALLSCPTGSIHTETPPADIIDAQKTFPIPIDKDKLPGVFHCGYHSKKSFGAASYLILHPEGNILVDSPRYTERLASKMEMMGGARYLFLTHKDDVADHDKWSSRLGCTRVLHAEDVQCSTTDVEMKLEGRGPWSLYQDIMLIHTPGHTEGSVSLFHKSCKAIFVGDHLGMSESGLTIFERYNQLSIPMQLKSVKALIDLDFKWILPGHGRRAYFDDDGEKKSQLEAMLNRYERLTS